MVDAAFIKSRGRIIRGKTKRKEEHRLLHRPILQRDTRLDDYFMYLPASQLELNLDPLMHYKESTKDLSAFDPPQLMLKQSWSAGTGRFVSYVVEPDQNGQGVITSLSFVSVHGPDNFLPTLEAACLTYNSIFTVYYLLLTSGQFAAERPKVLEREALSVPIPGQEEGLLKGLSDYADVDDRVRRMFGFSDVEWALIEDIFVYTAPYFKSNKSYPANRTNREITGNSELEVYAEYFLKVLRAGFGEEKRLSCVAFVEPIDQQRLPVRLLAVYLDSPLDEPYNTKEMQGAELYSRLTSFYSSLMRLDSSNAGGILFQRIARIYDVTDIAGAKAPTVLHR